jgi:hypothetical protein
MAYKGLAPYLLVILGVALAACSEEEVPPSVDIKIVEREDFTYSAGYGNGCRFKYQIINNTDDQLAKLDAFILSEDKFLFSVSGELPPRGAMTRTTDVQQNKRCRNIPGDLGLRKTACALGSKSQDECFAILQLLPPEE